MAGSDYDVLIAGGGPAGSALALALADGRRRVVVVEARAAPASDGRSIALAAGSARLLDALGVWPAMAADAVAIERVEVSQQGHFGRTRIDAADEGLAALGYVVPHARLAATLTDAAARAPGVEWRAPARVAGATRTGHDAIAIDIEADDAHQAISCRARLAVAADGSDSPLRSALGIATVTHDYHQTALVAPVEAGGDPHTAHERFTPDGPLALLPLGGRRRTLVWSLSAERAAEWAEAPVEAFARAAERRLGRSLGPLTVRAAPVAQPLARIEAEATTAARAALIGNAARTLHPVGAQGFNLALRDVCTLAEAIAAADDAGAPAMLEAWRRARRGDQWRTREFTDLLARRFHRGGSAAAAGRLGALVGLDLCGPGRRGLAAQATGLLGALPRVGTWRVEHADERDAAR